MKLEEKFEKIIFLLKEKELIGTEKEINKIIIKIDSLLKEIGEELEVRRNKLE